MLGLQKRKHSAGVTRQYFGQLGKRGNCQREVSSSAEDDSGAAGITQSIYVDGALVATGKGSSLAYNWAGNSSTTSVSVMN